MYQDSVTKQWPPAIIASLCQEKPVMVSSIIKDPNMWCLLSKDPSTSQAFYTPKQEHTINTTSDTTNGTTRPKVTNGTTNGTT